MAVAAAVLVGGRSERMGRDKATLELAGASMLAWVLAAVREAVDGPVALVTRAPRPDLAPWGLPQISDPPGAPACALAGLVAALRWAPSERVLVLPCDLPAVPAALLAELAVDRGAAIASVARADRPQRGEPLLAVYRTNLAGEAGDALEAGRLRVDGWWPADGVWLVPAARRLALDPDGGSQANTNRPEELATVAASLRSRHPRPPSDPTLAGGDRLPASDHPAGA